MNKEREKWQKMISIISQRILVRFYTERRISYSLSKCWLSCSSILRIGWLARRYLRFTIYCWKSFRFYHCLLLDNNDVLRFGRLCRRNTKDYSCGTSNRRWVITLMRRCVNLDNCLVFSSSSFFAPRWSQIEGLYLLHNPDVSVVSVGSKDYNIYYLLDGLHARGWHLNGLQTPAGFIFSWDLSCSLCHGLFLFTQLLVYTSQ